MPSFNDLMGGVLAVAAVAVVSYLAILRGSEQAEGAIIALLAAAVGWLYRGRLQNPGAGEVTLSASAPATASIRTAPPVPDVPPVRPAEIVQPPRPPRDI